MMRGQTFENWKLRLIGKPIEDSFRYDEDSGVMSVADGVTRDCLNGVPAGKNLSTFLRYPNPSPAKQTAEAFTDAISMALRESNGDITEESIRESFIFGNQSIREYTAGSMNCDVDYLANDFPGCVGAVAVLGEDSVSLGYICDSGVALLDEFGNLKNKTEDDGPKKHDKFIWPRIRERLGPKADWSMSEARVALRRDYRNNPQNPSFGVLTGQDEAIGYVRTDKWERQPGDIVLVYTDGVEGILFGGMGILAENLLTGC